jgi:hypothetical protein
MRGKCRMLRFKIVVIRIRGPCNLTGGYRSFGQDMLRPSSDGLWKYSQKIPPKHSQLCTTLYCVLTQTALWILTSLSTSNHMPKNIENWSMNGNVTLGKLKYRKAECFVQTQCLTLHSFSNSCVCSVSYFASQTNWGSEIFNTSWLATLSVQIHILGPGTHKMNFKILLKWYHKKNQTLILLKCWTFWKYQQLPALYTTVTTWNKLNTYTMFVIMWLWL